MELISYDEFGKLRLRDFFPAGTRIFLDEWGSTECAIGPAATEGMAFTYFAWRPEDGQKTAEISLDFREECPAEVGRKILDTIKVPLRPGMHLREIERVFGRPEFSMLSEQGEGVVRFICGEIWPYYVACNVTKDAGLTGIDVFRKDYWDPS
jgi:hypothetical protein